MIYTVDGKPSFRLDLYDHAVAHTWKKLIESIYVGDGEDIDNKRSLFPLWTIQEVRDLLVESIKNINRFLKRKFINVPTEDTWSDQNFYNEVHIAFEKLTGEFDKPTRFFQIAPIHIKESVKDLNYCVHRLEHNKDKGLSEYLDLQWTKNRTNTPRVKLEKNDYDLVQFTRKKNEVYLDYNELGKNFIDLWDDNLPINYSMAKNSHYVGADIKVNFIDKEEIFEEKFLDWCKLNNIDPFDKTQGVGLIAIGKIVPIRMDHLTKTSKIDIIIERKKNDESI